MTTIRPLTKEAHSHLRLSSEQNLSHVASEQLLPVLAQEFVSAASEFPIVFVKNSSTGQFQSVLLLALEQGCNEYVKDAHWQGRYLPQVLRYYPLCLAADTDNPQQLIVALDESSPRLNTQQGQPLFAPDGSESPFLQQQQQHLSQYVEQQHISEVFVNRLAELSLFSLQQLSVTLHGKPQQLNGLYVIDEQRLNSLTSADFSELRQRGFLPAIYAQIISLQRLGHLIRRVASQNTH